MTLCHMTEFVYFFQNFKKMLKLRLSETLFEYYCIFDVLKFTSKR